MPTMNSDLVILCGAISTVLDLFNIFYEFVYILALRAPAGADTHCRTFFVHMLPYGESVHLA